jgi:lysyl-tRNA synthetase class 2
VDNLWKLIRKTIAGPIFVTGLPKFFSPLSKSKEDNPAVVERIYPLIAGSELGNGFSELNDPLDQYQRFKKQQEMRESGDEEAHMLDIDFVEMLEYGMPPAFGFGMSERVFWFFEDVTAKEGVPFPQLRHKIDETTMEIYPYIRQIMESEEKDDAATINYTQDMSKKITIVINENLEDWKVLNTIGHISAYLGHETDNDFYSGPAYSTKDGEEFDRTCQYPIIVLSANPSQLQQLRKDLTDTNLMHYNFLAEHLEVEKDEDIAETLSDKTTEDIELYGIGILGDRDKLKDITGKFSLWRF